MDIRDLTCGADDGDRPARSGELHALLDRIRNGDEGAARELLERHEAQVRLVVRRQLPKILRARFDSLDFVQSVWASFFRRIQAGPERFEEPRCLVAFLAQAAKNKVIDQHRRAASRKCDVRREEPMWAGAFREVAADQDTPSELAQAEEALDRLCDLLPAGRREILRLKADGLSTREIADRLGLGERTVRRALMELRRRAGAGSDPGGDAT
jgi:RNA polymerase sigma-70 factor (ECF subfamily)